MAHLQLVEIIVDVLADGRRLPEIHGRALHRQDAAIRQGLGISPGVAVGKNLHLLLHGSLGACLIAVQIEVSMVGEVADSICIALCLIPDGKLIVIGQGIKSRHGHIAGIAAFAVLGMVGELHALKDHLIVPEVQMEALEAAMDMVLLLGTGVQLQLVLLATYDCLAPGNAVGMAAHHATHAGGVLLIGFGTVIAQDDIPLLEVLVPHDIAHQACAVRSDLHLRPLGIAQGEKEHLTPIRKLAERFFFDFCHSNPSGKELICYESTSILVNSLPFHTIQLYSFLIALSIIC